MATYTKTLTLGKSESETIKRYLSSPVLSSGDSVSNDAQFDNGKTMSIRCCGSDTEPAWTEAILTASGKNESELACSDARDTYFGEWKLTMGGDTYVVNVVEA